MHPVLGFAQLLRTDCDLRQRVCITCKGKSDGCGAQAQAVMSALLFAKTLGVTYLHSPFERVAHGPTNVKDWAFRCERFFGLGNGEDQVVGITVPLEKFSPEHCHERTLVEASHYHAFADRDPNLYRNLIPELQRKYPASDKSAFSLHRAATGITVGVHLRRGDVAQENPEFERHAHRYTPDEPVLRTLDGIRDVADELDLPVRFNVYSEGASDAFRGFVDAGCYLYLNGDPLESFHNLVCSTVLVMAKSSFSYVAGLLSTGDKMYEAYWHRPLSGWIIRGAGGEFDSFQLRIALSEICDTNLSNDKIASAGNGDLLSPGFAARGEAR